MRGFKNLLWYIGIVEDVYDPLKLGRVKVRAFGIHSQDKGDIPTEDLPWANLIVGTYNTAFKPPAMNSWVFGFFIDGDEAQHPMVLGVIPSMSTELPGFDDGQYGVLDNTTKACDTYQPDISRLARGENIEQTYVPVMNAAYHKDVKTANNETWTTPGSSYDAEYPHNLVYESAAGHVIEYDDTPGAERINIKHSTGSRMEIDSVGNIKIGSMGDIYIVSSGNHKTHIQGSKDITVDGNVNLYAKNNLTLKVDGDLQTDVHGDYTLNVAGNFQQNIGQGIDLRASRINLETLSSSINILSKDEVNITGEGESNIKGSALTLSADEDITLNAPGGIKLGGPLSSSTSEENAKGAYPTKIEGEPITIKTPVNVGVPSKVDNGIYATDDTAAEVSTGDLSHCDAYNTLKEQGLSHEQAIGVLANINRESGFKSDAIGDSGESYGLFQYYGGTSRRRKFEAAVPDWKTNPRGQIDYAINQDPAGVQYKNKSFSSSLEAANWFTNNFEIPAKRAEYTAPGGYNSKVVQEMEENIENCASKVR